MTQQMEPYELIMNWLKDCSPDYDLMYLDPLVCRIASGNNWGRYVPARIRRFFRSEDVSYAFKQNLSYGNPDKSSANFLERDGIGTLVKSDRSLQKAIAGTIGQYSNGSFSSEMSPTSGRQKHGRSLAAKGDKGNPESLITVDSMFATPARLPRDVTITLDVPTERRSGSVRRLFGVLVHEAAPLVTIEDNSIPIMADARTHGLPTVSIFLRLLRTIVT